MRSYTKEDFDVDVDWLCGYDIEKKEAAKFVRRLLNSEFENRVYFRKDVCPKCDKKDKVIPITYGYPSDKARRWASQGKIMLGGCVVSKNPPKFYCKRCEYYFRWNPKNFVDLMFNVKTKKV